MDSPFDGQQYSSGGLAARRARFTLLLQGDSVSAMKATDWEFKHRARVFGLILGAALLGVAAMLRTWASAYLHAEVVYASEVKTEALVADGPYRRVRNPLYL